MKFISRFVSEVVSAIKELLCIPTEPTRSREAQKVAVMDVNKGFVNHLEVLIRMDAEPGLYVSDTNAVSIASHDGTLSFVRHKDVSCSIHLHISQVLTEVKLIGYIQGSLYSTFETPYGKLRVVSSDEAILHVHSQHASIEEVTVNNLLVTATS